MLIQISSIDIFIAYDHVSIQMKRVKEINIKNHTYCFFIDMINIKNLDFNNIEMTNSHTKNILIYNIGYMAPNSVKPLYLMLNNTNRYIEEK